MRLRDSTRQRPGRTKVAGSLLPHQVHQALPFDERHREVRVPVSLAKIEYGEDVRVLELRKDRSLVPKSLNELYTRPNNPDAINLSLICSNGRR